MLQNDSLNNDILHLMQPFLVKTDFTRTPTCEELILLGIHMAKIMGTWVKKIVEFCLDRVIDLCLFLKSVSMMYTSFIICRLY